MHTHKKRSVFIYMLEGQKYSQHIMFALQTIKKWTDEEEEEEEEEETLFDPKSANVQCITLS